MAWLYIVIGLGIWWYLGWRAGIIQRQYVEAQKGQQWKTGDEFWARFGFVVCGGLFYLIVKRQQLYERDYKEDNTKPDHSWFGGKKK